MNTAVLSPENVEVLVEENRILKREIRYARESADITAELVVRQFEETESILRRLQEANAQRKAVLNSAQEVAIVATDIDGFITLFNKGAENLLGYKAEEVIRKMTPEAFHLPAELKRHAEMLGAKSGRIPSGIRVFFQYAGQGRREQSEWTYVRKDGSTFPVELSINTLKDAEGALSGFLCMATDITEKKRSEEALRKSEFNYRMLVSSIPNIVFKGYADGTIEFFDDKIETLIGYPKEAFVSRQLNWFDLIVEEDRPRVRRIFIEALKSNRSYIRQYRIRKKNGDTVWIEASSKIICDPDGNVEFVTGAFLDITERKRAEMDLHESEEKYRSLFDSGPNPIFVLERESLRILDANPSAAETYGYPRDYLIGLPFTELGELEEEDGAALFSSASWADGCVESQRVRHWKKGRRPFYIKVKTCPIRYKGKEAIILAATDITESVEKDAQLFQATKMSTLGEMSAGIAHELNQPLNAIKIGNEFLRLVEQQGTAIDPRDIGLVAEEVSNQVDRASEIINRLREFGRKPDFSRVQISVNTPIQRVLSIIGQQLSLQNIDVRLELDSLLPPILANVNRLEQVVFNMITNARDAIDQRSPESADATKRVITLRTFREDEYVAFSVSDTGVGISPEFREKIFEPFFTTKEVGKGMGLGLSIIYGIVKGYGGDIRMESTPGLGSTFTFRFPPMPAEDTSSI